jgi:hypothetical protein
MSNSITASHFSKIVVVQSLEPDEVQTGQDLAIFMNEESHLLELGLKVEFIDCSCANEFQEIVSGLAADADASGEIPVLHVECHGDREHGLVFSNGSELGWNSIAGILRPLNRSTGLNLLVIFSACFGGHYIREEAAHEAATFFALLAPEYAIDPAEIIRTFRSFYRTLFATRDAVAAVNSIQRPQSEGHWFMTLAETRYEKVVRGYVDSLCRRADFPERAEFLRRSLLAQGVDADTKEIEYHLTQCHREDILGKNFENYFMTEIPGNRERFSSAKQRLSKKLADLRSTGLYLL